ncbi:MAG: pancreas/duodenum homeobox protein 1 [Desulfamplus sp.]|nr:pancreas/duodenum homeobox protein 1 [Desulfamplus sp.]MBF0411979.1 pancreas/duodenum homeobox protein 1 [Desulfamplus sp.]
MTLIDGSGIFTRERLDEMFPSDRADNFFEALYGDVSEGAYDITLEFKGIEKNQLLFEFHLKQRPGKCLACNLTYGLPTVFERHPVINIKGLAKSIDTLLDGEFSCTGWHVGTTREKNRQLHVLPISFTIA